jgi:hypothetical protein
VRCAIRLLLRSHWIAWAFVLVALVCFGTAARWVYWGEYWKAMRNVAIGFLQLLLAMQREVFAWERRERQKIREEHARQLEQIRRGMPS